MQAALKQEHIEPRRPLRVSEHKTKDDMLILATNRFCDIDTHSRLSLDQYSEAFNLLIGQVSAATRQIVARRLAHSSFTPRSAALYLALEPIDVALPILAHSQAFGQLDLLRIADRMGLEHARAIASRLDVGPSLMKALKNLNDEEVMIALEDNDALMGNLENRSFDAMFAQIVDSEEEFAFGQAMDKTAQALAEETDAELASSGGDRDAEFNLSEGQSAEDLLWEMNEETAGALAANLSTYAEAPLADAPVAAARTPQAEVAEETTAETTDTAADAGAGLPQATTAPLNEAERALLAAAGRGNRADLPPMARPMENDFNFGDAFEKVARAHSHQGMAVLMQKRFNLALDTAHQVLDDKTGDTLAVLLSAADVPAAQANRIQLLTHPNIGLSSHNALRAVRFYGQLNSESSLAAVNQWPKAEDPKIGNHAPQLQEGRHEQRQLEKQQTGAGRTVDGAAAAAAALPQFEATG